MLIDSAEISVAAASETLDRVDSTPGVSLPKLADVLVALWLLGAAALLARSIVSTRRLAADPSVGTRARRRAAAEARPAEGFRVALRSAGARTDSRARASPPKLRSTVVNALVEVARCVNWFNPLVHLAASRVRADQELACDAAVIAARPTDRRAYAQALAEDSIAPAFLPLGCTWTSRVGRTPRGAHRDAGPAVADPPRRIRRRGAVAIVGLALGYAAWAQQPERVVTEVARGPKPCGRRPRARPRAL